MTARFRKKARKMRGSKTHGWGEKKKHRGGGSRAGRGGSNWLFAKKSYTLAYQPERLGKKGFVVKPERGKARSINLIDIEKLAMEKKCRDIDVSALGFDKVLGDGKLTIPLNIKARRITAKAKEKIEKAGGKAIETEPRAGEK